MSVSVIAGVDGTAGVTLGPGGAGQYQGRTSMMAHTSAMVFALQFGGGTTMIEPPEVLVAGFAGVPGLVLERTRLTPPPDGPRVIDPEVQSRSGAWQRALAEDTTASGESCAAMVAETTTTAAQRKAPTRNRWGRRGFRVGAMGKKIRRSAARASRIFHKLGKAQREGAVGN